MAPQFRKAMVDPKRSVSNCRPRILPQRPPMTPSLRLEPARVGDTWRTLAMLAAKEVRLSNNIRLRIRVNLLWRFQCRGVSCAAAAGRLVTRFILSFGICAVILAALGTRPHRVEFVLVQSEFVRGFLTVLLYVSLVSVLPWQVGLWWSGRDRGGAADIRRVSALRTSDHHYPHHRRVWTDGLRPLADPLTIPTNPETSACRVSTLSMHSSALRPSPATIPLREGLGMDRRGRSAARAVARCASLDRIARRLGVPAQNSETPSKCSVSCTTAIPSWA